MHCRTTHVLSHTYTHTQTQCDFKKKLNWSLGNHVFSIQKNLYYLERSIQSNPLNLYTGFYAKSIDKAKIGKTNILKNLSDRRNKIVKNK